MCSPYDSEASPRVYTVSRLRLVSADVWSHVINNLLMPYQNIALAAYFRQGFGRDLRLSVNCTDIGSSSIGNVWRCTCIRRFIATLVAV